MTKLLKRLIVDIVGIMLILAGLLFGWLPGPGGIPLILAGLGLLAIHNEWAKKLLDNFEAKFKEISHRFFQASPSVQIALDILAISAITLGAMVVVNISGYTKNIGWIFMTFGLFLILLNKERGLRIWQKISRKS